MHEYAEENYLDEILNLAEWVENAIRGVIPPEVWRKYRVSYIREFDTWGVTIKVRIPFNPGDDC
jgi:hypothetical protein